MDNYFTFSMENMMVKHKMTKGQTDCHGQVRDLIQKLKYWRDESHKNISDIISAHTGYIDIGFKKLAEEFEDLEAQVSVLRKEKSVLLETIDNLNNEIRQVGAKLEGAETKGQEVEKCEVDFPDIKDEFVEAPWIRSGFADGEKYSDSEHSEDRGDKNTEDRLVSVREQNVLNEKTSVPNLDSEDFICIKCKFVFSTKENLVIHMKNVHTKSGTTRVHQENEESMDKGNLSLNDKELPSESNYSIEDIKFKCEKCPLAYSHIASLNRHVKLIHNKIKEARNQACPECAYITSRKSSLKRHLDSVHNKGSRKFKCTECPYSSAQKAKLRKHIESRHNQGNNKSVLTH